MIRMLLVPMMIVALALVGCGQKEASEGGAEGEGAGSVPGMSEEAAEALESAHEAGESALRSATDAAEGAAKDAGEAAEKMAAEAKAQADKLLGEAKECIDSGKFDEAKAALANLGAMKDQLPEEVAAKLTELEDAYEKAVDAAKSMANAAKPPLGGSE